MPSSKGSPTAPPVTSASGVAVQLYAQIEVAGVSLFVVEESVPRVGEPGRDRVIAIDLSEFSTNQEDTTVGGLIAKLIEAVEPGRTLDLEPPWDALNRIPLPVPNLAVKINLTQRSFGFSASLPNAFDLGLLKLTGFDLAYRPKRGKERQKLDFSLVGSVGGRPLKLPTWDVFKQPPPPPVAPAAKPPILDLELLAAGQHVALALPSTPNALAPPVTISGLVETLRGVEKPGIAKNPLPAGLRYSAESNWLIAFSFAVMGAVKLKGVFNDPNLYGMRIELDGAKVKALAGLQFEILYRKIADGLGVYHLELRLPDKMRRFEVGAATITLPIITLDIYTNGGFLIDFGFPRNHDYSRSAVLEMIILGVPVLGGGGFYFGVLDGRAVPTLPTVTRLIAGQQDGQFSPVIVFGLGLKIGIGKSFDKGILRAGFEISIEGILEGIVAFYESKDKALQDTYFKVSGSLTLVGHLYGSVDFAIIKAKVDVLVVASVAFVYEAYTGATIVLEASISIQLSVEVDLFLFSFTVELSFSASIRQEFQIDARGEAQWLAPKAKRLRLAALETVAIGDRSQLTRTKVDLFVRTVPTVTGDGQSPRMVTLLLVKTAKPATGDSDFVRIAKAAFNWARGSETDEVNPKVLDALAPADGRFTEDEHNKISDLLTMFDFTLKQLDEKEAAGQTFTVIPMPPNAELTLDGKRQPFPSVKPDYLSGVAALFAAGAARADDVTSKPASITGDTPLVTVLIGDYFLMMINQAIKAGQAEVEKQKKQNPLAAPKITLAQLPFNDLAGVVSRFMLHGLRLPDPAKLADFAKPQKQPSEDWKGVYELAGVQTEPRDAKLKLGTSTVDLTQPPALTGLATFDPTQAIRAKTQFPPYVIVDKVFAFGRPAVWQAGAEERWLYPMPEAFRQHLTRHPSAPSKVRFTDGKALTWATRLDFTVRAALDPETGAPVPFLYEIADKNDDDLDDLKLVLPSVVANAIHVITGGEDRDGKDRLESKTATVRLIQSNLAQSGTSIIAAAHAGAPKDFVALLIECASTRAGGFFLEYKAGANGLPAKIFEQSAEATVTILIEASAADAAKLFHNCAFIAKAAIADPAVTPLSILPPAATITAANQRIGATANATTPNLLTAGKELTVVEPRRTQSGDTLRAIAEALGSSVEQVHEAVVTASAWELNSKITPSADLPADTITAANQRIAAAANATTPNLLKAGQELQVAVTWKILRGDDLLGISQALGVTVEQVHDAAVAASAWELNKEIKPSVDWVVRRSTLAPENAGFRILAAVPEKKSAGELFSLLAFSLDGGQEALPAAPSDGDHQEKHGSVEEARQWPWVYQQVLQIAPANQPYVKLGQEVKLTFSYNDLYGNRWPLPAGKRPQLTQRILYRDELLGLGQWPALTAVFDFAPEAKLQVALRFDASRYLETADRAERIKNDITRYTRILAQLDRPDVEVRAASGLGEVPVPVGDVPPVGTAAQTIEKTKLVEFAKQAKQHLGRIASPAPVSATGVAFDYVGRAGATITLRARNNGDKAITTLAVTAVTPAVKELPSAMKNVPSGATRDFTVTLTTADPHAALELTLSASAEGTPVPSAKVSALAELAFGLTLFPKSGEVLTPVSASLEIKRVNTGLIDPLFVSQEGVQRVSSSLEPAYEASEKSDASLIAFAERVEKAFPGVRVVAGEGKRLMALRLGGAELSYEILKTPRTYALPPLSTIPFSKSGVDIQPYEAGKPLTAAVKKSFRGIDLDVWARAFLRDVDLALSPRFAAAMPETALKTLLAAKKSLAEAIHDDVLEVEERSPQASAADLAAAREGLKKRLLVRLSDAYAIDTIVQYPVNVTNAGAAGRLFLQPVDRRANQQNKPSLSEAVLDLRPGARHLSFFFDSTTETAASSITAQLDFQSTAIQFGDERFHFVVPTPRVDTAGEVEIPVPLRAFPVPPTLTAQRITPAEGNRLIDLKSYDYAYEFSTTAAAQDLVKNDTLFNLVEQPPVAPPVGDLSGQLPLALAQYIDIADGLKRDWNEAPATAENAFAIFAQQATLLATAWASWKVAARVVETSAQLGNEVKGNNVLQRQTVLGQIDVTRNQKLTKNGKTRAEFVYVLPDIRFPNPLVPLVTNHTEFRIERDLADFFKELLELTATGRFVRVAVWHEFELAPEIRTAVPVLMRPKFLFQQTDLASTGFCGDLAKALTQWKADHAVVAGDWILDVSVFTTLNKAESSLPLLELTNIRMSVTKS